MGLIVSLVVVFTVGGPAVAKQNVQVELFYNGVWNDHTADLFGRNPLTINHAAGNLQDGVVPTDGTLTFKGNDGRMNPDNPKSPLFGLIGYKTPIRAKADGDIRISGRTVSWKPRRGKGGSKFVAWVEVTIGGKVFELGQGDQPKRSAMRRAYDAAQPLAYWPLEDSSSATQAASAVNGVGPMILSGNGLTKFGSLAGPPGAATAADTSQTSVAADVMAGTIPDVPGATSWRVDFSILYRTSDATFAVDMPGWSTRGGVQSWFLAQSEAGTGLRLFYVDATDIWLAASAPDVEHNDGIWHLYTIIAAQDGADIDVTVKVDGVAVISTTVTAHAFGTPSEMFGQAGVFSADPIAAGISHTAVWAPSSATDMMPAFRGHVGETAGARFGRICDELGITDTLVGVEAETQLMGPQPAGTDLEVFADIARTDAGIIHDTRTQFGLTLRTGRSLLDQ